MSESKACSVCRVVKPLLMFSVEKRQKDGRRSVCKACISAQGRPYREQTKEQKAAYDAQYRATNKTSLAEKRAAYARANAEKIREYRSANRERRKAVWDAWNAKNKESKAAERKRKYAADPEAARAKTAAWRAAHPESARSYRRRNAERLRASYHKRRALKLAAGGVYTPEQIVELAAKQRMKCAVCRISLRGARHIDHILPLARGGTNDITNIQLTCRTCNLRKHSKHPVDFMREMGFLL